VIRRVALALLVLVFAGCASIAPSDITSPWTTGRLSLRVDASAATPAQSMSAAFELRGDNDRGELNLLSPLGTRLAAARWAPGSALIVTPDGERRYATLEELSRQALGEPVPLAAMPDWLAGRPWPRAPHEMQPDGFGQLGWHVQTARRSEGWIEARRTTPPAVLLRVRLDL
jgi:outer membrane lipoprotein LolB